MRSHVPSRLARLVALLALLALGAFAPVAPAAPQGPWVLPATDISTGVTPSPAASQVAVGPDGTTTVVWTGFQDAAATVYARTRPPGGSFGPAVALSAADEYAVTPEIATGADGTTAVTWTSEGSVFTARVAIRKGPSAAFGAPVTVSDASGPRDAQLPRVAVTTDGTVIVAWYGYDGTASNWGIQAATGTSGGGFAAPVTLDTVPSGDFLSPPRVATGAGETLVVWTRYSGTGNVVVAAIRSAGGAFGSATALSPDHGDASRAVGAIAADGSATVVYLDNVVGAVTPMAVARPAGGAFGAPAAIGPVSQFAPGEPDLAIAPDGVRTAVWEGYDGTDDVAWVTTSSASGVFPDPVATPPVRLNAVGHSAFGARVAASLDGTATVVWSDGLQPLTDSLPRIPRLNYTVTARTRPPGGTFGEATQLGSGAQPSFTFRNGISAGLPPAVGVGPNGVATTSWTQGGVVVLSAAQRGALVNGAVQVASTAWPAMKLTVTTSPGGTVTSTPAGVDCGATCAFAFPELTEVTLTAAPTGASTFTGWGGACAGTALTCKVSMTEARNVTATFRPALTVSRSGTGKGTVTSSPAGISCGTDCVQPYDANTVVTLVAVPASGAGFTRWGGACVPVKGRPLRCTVTMSDVRAVTATFARGPLVTVRGGALVIVHGTRGAALRILSSRAGTATVTATSCADVACASMAARLVAVKKVPSGRSTIRIRTGRLRIGTYRLAVRVTANRITSKPATTTLTVRPRPHFTG